MASFIVNAFHVNFESVLSVDDAGMVKMFRSQKTSGTSRFLRVSDSVFEEALSQFFVNASVIAGKIVSTMGNKKLVITMDVFAESFQLPTEGMVRFSGLSAKEVDYIKVLFSASDVPFKPSNKNKGMKVE
ncbi:hypothetical protein F511_31265 [Dorcoceras hygrometricum]|uniref:Uncharacterized protein n=1 Tax=Dorcoceras hygrometricum TaxID=472368 RepID=A0A2Z7BXW7_9LAMI|nr:hypothetical protein F511_31265 [Dorcoceras hygrometricum]